MATAVKIDSLSKRYIIGHKNKEHYSALRDVVADRVAGVGRNILNLATGNRAVTDDITQEEFWALKNINMEIKQGDRVGIIGRNGAGKSTLLKILSRITEPTHGKVSIKGRVASLLEVGTGFHPELTGRENIFLNAAILGMSKAEIKEKFGAIVAFAEVERFLDTPVKRYSSGMYVRLAFSVAAHLDPEILIVDEVLAVGDSAFQKKCLGKMEDVGKEGRTVLFVSHNMATIEQLCTKCAVLESGEVAFTGGTEDAIKYYIESLNTVENKRIAEKQRKGSGEIRITNITFRGRDGNATGHIRCGEETSICIEYEKQSDDELSDVVVGVSFKNEMGFPIFLQHSRLSGQKFNQIPDTGIFVCELDSVPLVPASYYLNASIFKNGTLGAETVDVLENAAILNVEAGNYFGTGELPGAGHGPVLIKAKWSLSNTTSIT